MTDADGNAQSEGRSLESADETIAGGASSPPETARSSERETDGTTQTTNSNVVEDDEIPFVDRTAKPSPPELVVEQAIVENVVSESVDDVIEQVEQERPTPEPNIEVSSQPVEAETSEPVVEDAAHPSDGVTPPPVGGFDSRPDDVKIPERSATVVPPSEAAGQDSQIQNGSAEKLSVVGLDAQTTPTPTKGSPVSNMQSPGPAKPPAKKPPVKVLEGVVTAVSSDEVDLRLPDGRSAVIYRRNFGLNDEEPSTVLSVGDGAIGAELAREDPKRRVVLSRSWVLKKQKWEKLEASAEASNFISGKVISTNKNGLVLDVGVRAFVPASHVELQPVKDLTSYVGQTLEAKIIEINPSSERLVLSRRPILLRAQRQKIKELLSGLNPGDVRSGVVVSLADYGAFVDLGGVKGLVHVSEMAWERIGKPADLLSVGDEIDVRILDINVKKRRIGLSIRQLKDDPLSGIEVDAILTGKVTRLVDFGAFVDLGVIEGLVHLSELAEYRVQAPEEIVTPGDEIRVKVLSVDSKRRRVALSVRQAAEFGG